MTTEFTVSPIGVQGAAALTASQDNIYTFGSNANNPSQARKVIIQNNTAASINYNLDAAANPGTLSLAANAQVILDVPITKLHFYSTGTPNVNGNTGTNIVVLAWG